MNRKALILYFLLNVILTIVYSALVPDMLFPYAFSCCVILLLMSLLLCLKRNGVSGWQAFNLSPVPEKQHEKNRDSDETQGK